MGLVLYVGAIVVSTGQREYREFVWIYGGLGGFGVGLAVRSRQFVGVYMACWSHYQVHKGFVSAYIGTAFGLGPACFALLSAYIVNPTDALPSFLSGFPRFGPAVASQAPVMLQVLAVVYAAMGFFGFLLIREVPVLPVPGKYAHGRFFITTTQFIKLPIAISLAYPLPFYLSNSLKGSLFFRFQNDWGLSLIAVIGAIACASGRAFSGNLFQRINFKVPYSALLLVQALFAFTSRDLLQSWEGLSLVTAVVMAVEGGHYLLLPATCSGFLTGVSGGSLFAVVHAAMALAAWEVYALMQVCTEEVIWRVLGGMTVAALLLVSSFEETYSNQRQVWMRALESPLNQSA